MSSNNENTLRSEDPPPLSPMSIDLPVRSEDQMFDPLWRWAEERAHLRARQEERYANINIGNKEQRKRYSARASELKQRYFSMALQDVQLERGIAGYPMYLVVDLEQLCRKVTIERDQCKRDNQIWRTKFEAKARECVKLSNRIDNLDRNQRQDADEGVQGSEPFKKLNEDLEKCRQELQMCKEETEVLRLGRIVINKLFGGETSCNDNHVPASTVTMTTTPFSVCTSLADSPTSADRAAQASSSKSHAPCTGTHVYLPTSEPVEVEVHFETESVSPGDEGKEQNGIRKERGLTNHRLSVSQGGLITKKRKDLSLRIVLPSLQKVPYELKLPSPRRNKHF